MNDNEVALALSSGGARGAYEVGAMLFLAERGLRFNAVSGASIGALNGAFYAQGNGSPDEMQKLAEFWRQLPSAGIVQINASQVAAALASLAVKELPYTARTLQALKIGKGGFLDPKPMEKLIDRWIDYDAVKKSKTDLLIAAIKETEPLLDIATHPWRNATYFRASECTKEELRNALLAAAAMPLFFPSRKVGKKKFADAGLVDPLPAGELYRRGHRRLVSVFLSDNIIQNRADFPDAVVLQIRPSVNINAGLLSCFDFSSESIERRMKLGYDDAKTYLEEAQDIFENLKELKTLGDIEEKLAKKLPDRRRR